MTILNLISTNNYIVFNTTLAKELGLHETLLLGALATQQDYWGRENKVDDDGYFFMTQDEIENRTTLSPYQQRVAISNLEGRNLIHTKMKGLPAKKYYLIDVKELNKLVLNQDVKEFDIRCEKIKHQEVKKFDTNNNIYNNNKEYNTISKDIVTNSNEFPFDDGGRVLNGEKDFDKYICSLKNSQSTNTCSPTKKEVDENKTKAYKKVMGYINSLPYEADTKEALVNWYDIVGKGCVSIGQLKDKLDKIEKATNNNMQIMKQCFDEATGKHWYAFFYNPPKQQYNNNQQINTMNFKQPTKKITMEDVIPFDKDPDVQWL